MFKDIKVGNNNLEKGDWTFVVKDSLVSLVVFLTWLEKNYPKIVWLSGKRPLAGLTNGYHTGIKCSNGTLTRHTIPYDQADYSSPVIISITNAINNKVINIINDE